MVLDVQIVSLLASLGYGMFFYLMLEFSSRVIYSSHLGVRIIGTLLFVMFHTLLYFLILMKINNGYVHGYFFLCLSAGYGGCKVVYKRFVKKK